jgi:hypothetical protein
MPNFSTERDLAFLLSDTARLLRTCADQEARRFGMTRAQWEDSINLMIRRHNMPALDDKDRERVLNYLETAYPPRAPAGRGGWVNPFAK